MAADVTIREDRFRDASAMATGAAFGLYPASDFRLTDGLCKIPHAGAGAVVFPARGDRGREAREAGSLVRQGVVRHR